MKQTKRDILKGLAVGSVWSTPIASSAILPAHAQTTACGPVSASETFEGDIDRIILLVDPDESGCMLVAIDSTNEDFGLEREEVPNLVIELDHDVEGVETYDISFPTGSNDWSVNGAPVEGNNFTMTPLRFTATRLTGSSAGMIISVTLSMSWGPAPDFVLTAVAEVERLS